MAFAAALPAIGLMSTALGAGVSAMGAIQGAQSQAAMYQYQSGVAALNEKIAKQNADYAVHVGEMEAQRAGMATRAKVGETLAAQGAGGLAVGSGSQGRVVDSELQLGQFDEATIRNKALRTAYGYEVEATKYGAEVQMDQAAASGAKAGGYLSAFGSLLGGAAGVSSKWMQATQAGVVF